MLLLPSSNRGADICPAGFMPLYVQLSLCNGQSPGIPSMLEIGLGDTAHLLVNTLMDEKA